MKLKESKDGKLYKPLYIKYMMIEDYKALEDVKNMAQVKTDAEAIRWALRRLTNRA